jgi:CRP/FNR family transcriptional regulator, nitrogen oxide reductase regulator
LEDALMSASVSLSVFSGFKSAFLSGFPPGELNYIVGAATQRHFPADSIVVSQGQPAEVLFVLTKGRARYFFITADGRKLLLPWIAPGEIFGGMAILAVPSFYLAGTETLKESHVLAWDRSTLRRLAIQYPRLLENALTIASDYFSWYLATHAALTADTARQKLAQTIINLARGIGKRVPAGVELEITNEDLSYAASMTLFTVSRLISEWRHRGVIAKSRGKLVLRPSTVLT